MNATQVKAPRDHPQICRRKLENLAVALQDPATRTTCALASAISR
jgi:hypothetical protein